MKRKVKYNFDNSLIVIAYEDGKAENIINKKTNESMLNYIDQLFCTFESQNKIIKYKVYTSTLSKRKAEEKFPFQCCDVCGSISNKLFLTYRGEICIGRSIECTICYPEPDFLASTKQGLKASLKLVKYNEVKKYKKFIKEKYKKS